MYGRTRRYYDSRRKREAIGGYLRTVLWILTIVGIIVVCTAMAMQTAKASQVVAAEKTVLQASVAVDEENIINVARAVSVGPALVKKAASEREKEEAERVIVIDAGHGGMDGGCVFDDVLEKEINREIAWEVTRKLRKKGYRVVLVRKGDDYMEKMDRVEQANRLNARLYVSIHQNSCDVRSVSGIETWYGENDKTGDSRRLADLIQQETVKATGAMGRELVSDAELCVVNKSNMPSCLIETGFLSNKEEREKLCTKEYREQVAEGIVNGINLYLSS